MPNEGRGPHSVPKRRSTALECLVATAGITIEDLFAPAKLGQAATTSATFGANEFTKAPSSAK